MDHTDLMFNEAARHHQAGRLSQAEEIYRRILLIDSQQPNCLHMLGVVAYQTDRLALAADLIEQAIAMHNDVASWHSNLGNVRKDQGQPEQAMASYERAIQLDPSLAETHCNLANLLRRQGRLDAAMASYLRAASIRPGLAVAHFGRGSILLFRSMLDEAVACFQSAVAIDPTYAEAHNSLGYALHLQGKLNAAAQCYQRALAIRPDHSDACNNLGYTLHALGNLDAARSWYQRALVLRPRFSEVHNNLGNVLKDQGDFAAARACYDRAIDIESQYAEAHFNRADVTTFKADDAELQLLEQLAAKSDELPAPRRPYIHFAFAKALDDVGAYSRSFEHLLRGNALKRMQITYDEQATRNLFRTIAHTFDAGIFERLRAVANPSAVPIFVVGMPRSGTTLIEQILSSHPQVHGAGELLDLDIVVSNVLAQQNAGAYPGGIGSLAAASVRCIGENYLARLPDLPPGATRVTDKLPGNFVHVGLLRICFPNSRIIHAMRDPVDTCVSCFSKLFDHGQAFSYDLAELGRYYRYYSELMANWRSVLPQDAMLEVSYEDVVNDHERQVRRMIEYCGLPWDDRCLSFHRTARTVATASALQVRQALYDTSIGRWRRHANDLSPLLTELAAIMRA